MTRITYFVLAGTLTGCLALSAGAQSQSTQSQSLGDYARTVRKDKPKDSQTKQYDNDNLPKTDKLSVVGAAPDTTADNNQAQTAAATETKPAEPSAAQSSKDRQKSYDDWKQKISDQKDKVTLATRELDVLQREYKLRAAAFYGDAGNRLRNQGSWDKDDAQYKQQIADKQKAVDDAKKQLDDLQEQARKSGAPNSVRE
jgi:hypothetical protein